MERFKFQNGQEVQIICSQEQGEVIGRAEYLHGEDQYYIRYKAADGRAVEAWWPASSLELVYG